MSHNFFAYISRMRYIARWGLMRNTFSENIQEHSHQVAVLAHALAVIRNERFGGRVPDNMEDLLTLPRALARQNPQEWIYCPTSSTSAAAKASSVG